MVLEPISLSATALTLIKGIIKVVDVANKTIESFNTEYDNLKTILEDLTPRIESVRKFDDEIADESTDDVRTAKRRTEMNKLVEQLKDCQQLVEKCARLPLWRLEKIRSYGDKLKRHNNFLKEFVARVMVADIWEVTITNVRVKGEYSVPKPPKFLVGWRDSIEELKQKLRGHSVTGICGPGGYGKTTLVRKICEQVKGEFERISYIGIPRKPDCPDEKEETEKLDWTVVFNKLWEDLVAYGEKPKSTCKEDALQQLEESLNKRKKLGEGLLVVLDGVWSARMLRSLVIKTPGLRTLVTSRKRLHGLDCCYDVPQLTMRDAKDLFLHHALSGERTSEHLDEVLVEQIVKGCKFQPLALELIGSSLKNVMSRSWTTTARTLLGEGGIFKQCEDVYWPLKTSLDSLKEAVQLKCFMDLCCFPDNKRIRAAVLMDMWVHTRGQDENGAYNILKMLADRYLIELFKRTRNMTTDDDESFGDLFVAQHDLLSELAVHVSKEEDSNKRFIINHGWDTFPGDMESQAQIVSIHNGESVDFEGIDVQFSAAEVLMLNFSSCSYCLPPFLNKMENLKVLIIANHNMAAAVLEGLPPSRSLKSLRVVRLEKISLPIDYTSKEPFKGVEKLSLILCEVDEKLIGSEFDIQAMFPDLTELEIDYCNGLERLPNEVCNIDSLRKLSITNCHDLNELPEEIDRLSKLEVLRLSACTSLERLPNSLVALGKLRFLDLFRCSLLEQLPQNMDSLDSLEKVDLRTCSAKLPVDKVMNFKRLQYVLCDHDAKSMWGSVRTQCGQLSVSESKEFVSLNFLS